MLRRTLILSVIGLLSAGPASAGPIGARLTLVPGRLTVGFAHVSASASGIVEVPVLVTDARGSGRGWTLRVVALRPVRIVGISARCAPGSTCTLPGAWTGTDGQVVLEAARDSGMGAIDVVVRIAALPAGTPRAPLAFTVS